MKTIRMGSSKGRKNNFPTVFRISQEGKKNGVSSEKPGTFFGGGNICGGFVTWFHHYFGKG